MPSDEALHDILSRASVLLNGDARDREQATGLLAELRDRYPHSPEAQTARQLLIRAQPPAWSAFDEADGLDDLETEWDLIRRPDDSRVRGLFGRAFDPRRIGSPRLDGLRERMLDFLAGIDHTAASPDLLRWMAGLYDVVARNPSSRERGARGRDRIAAHLFRRRLDGVAAQVAEALERWDVEAAGAALDALGPAPDACARDVAALQARAADVLHRRVLVQAALDRAGSTIIRSPADGTILAAALDELAAHRGGAALPERFVRAIAEADSAAAAAVARWGADAARAARGLDGLADFQREWARLPPRWQTLVQADWFAPAWTGIQEQARNTLALAADWPDVDALAKGFHDAAPVLPKPLAAEAWAIARAMTDLAHVWRQAAAGIVAPMPDMSALTDPVTLPEAFSRLQQAAAAADHILADADEALAAAEASADASAATSVKERLNALCARYPQLARAQRLRERADAVVARTAVRLALAEWRVEEAVANMQRADSSIDPARLNVLRGALNDFAMLAAAQATGAMAAQLAWWDRWLMALCKLPALRLWPPGLDGALLALHRDRLNRLSAAVDAELADPARTAADFRMLATLFAAAADYPPLRFEMDRLHRRSLALDFEATAEKADWQRAEELLEELQALGEPQDRLAVLRLRVDLGQAAAAGDLAARLVQRWHDVRTLVPEHAPRLALDALRGQRLAGVEPAALDRHLADCAVHAAGLAPPGSSLAEELAFWAEWSVLVDALWKAPAPTDDVLLRTAAFFRRIAPEWRRSLRADMRRLIDVWQNRGEAVVLAWASRLFSTLEGVKIVPDPLDGLQKEAVAAASRVMADLTRLPQLSAEALKEPRRVLHGEHDRWMRLTRLLDAAGDGGSRSVPDALADAVTIVNTLAILADEMKSLETADFRDAGLGMHIASVRSRMIAVSATAALPSLETVADTLNRIEQACSVRHVWQEFDTLCALVRDDRAPLDGTNGRIRRLLEEITDILHRHHVDDRPGGVVLVRDAARCLADANPALPVADGPMVASELLGFANRLCQEEEQARAGLILIEQRLPRGALGNPDDRRYDSFFQSLPLHPPVGSIAQRLYRAFMRRDPMPGIARQAPHRLPKWLTAM